MMNMNKQEILNLNLHQQSTLRTIDVWGMVKWALVSADGVAPSRMVGVSASVNLPMHHKVQKFSSGSGSPGWSRKKGRKWLWWW